MLPKKLTKDIGTFSKNKSAMNRNITETTKSIVHNLISVRNNRELSVSLPENPKFTFGIP